MVAVLVALAGATATASQSVAATSLTDSSVPVIPPLPMGFTDNAAEIGGTTTVPKAKIMLTIPVTLFRAYVLAKSGPIPGGGFKLTTDVRAFVLSPASQKQKFGLFKQIPTAVSAFGSIPVTAEVHLSQLVDGNNEVVPFELTNSSSSNSLGVFVSTKTTVVGALNLTVSDVRVDKVPLDVGPNCRAVTPIPVNLIGRSDLPIGAPGAYNVFLGGPLSGVTTIPAFTGCGVTENLNPILTDFISGPNSVINLVQGGLGTFKPPRNCTGCTPPVFTTTK